MRTSQGIFGAGLRDGKDKVLGDKPQGREGLLAGAGQGIQVLSGHSAHTVCDCLHSAGHHGPQVSVKHATISKLVIDESGKWAGLVHGPQVSVKHATISKLVIDESGKWAGFVRLPIIREIWGKIRAVCCSVIC